MTSSPGQVGANRLLIEGLTAGDLRFAFADLFDRARCGQDVQSLLKRREVVRRDQHGGRVSMLRDGHAGVGGLDIGNQLGQSISGIGQRHFTHRQKYSQFGAADDR